MRRELTGEEKEINLKQIEMQTKQVKDIEDNLAYNKDLVERQRKTRIFEDEEKAFKDKWREFLRTQKDRDDIKIIKQIGEQLQNLKESVELMQAQIKEGVEIKEKDEEGNYIG
jgi:hypothetical protein